MATRSQFSAAFAAFFLLLACAWQFEAVTSRPDGLLTMILGGPRDVRRGKQNAADIDALALFAVQEHNKQQNAMLQFVRVLKSKEQVVAGTMYHLTLEAIDAGTKKLYEVKVWVKPWMNFKQLQEFKPVAAPPSVDLGVKRD